MSYRFMMKYARPPLLKSLSLFALSALLTPVGLMETTNITFHVPGEGSARSRVSFDNGWTFARYGLQADGSCKAEPGRSPDAPCPFTASSEEMDKGNEAANAFDDDLVTRWCAKGPGANQWIAVDLGEPTALGSIDIKWDQKLDPTSVIGSTFLIEASADGERWEELAKGTSADPIKLVGTARHLRVRVTSIPSGQWVSFSEVIITDPSGKKVEPVLAKSPPLLPGKTPAFPEFDDSGWRKLDLPHDWGIEGPFRKDLPGATGKLPWKGIGWYRKKFVLPAEDKGRSFYLDFDGAMANAEVSINGNPLPAHPYGYTSFRLDLTPHLNFGGENVVAVRLNTEKWDSRWYPGAGIYRHTWLVKTAPVHVADEGVTLTTPSVDAKKATARLVVRLDNPEKTPVSFRTRIFPLNAKDGVGPVVATVESKEPDFTLDVSEPKLWNTKTPNRYLARVEVISAGKPVDTYDVPFGFRTLKVTPRSGLFINGERTMLNGVCLHHDLGALGAALNDRALERQLEMMKEMGANAIRTSHNPPPTELLDIADRMGFLLQVEAFDCWRGGKNRFDYNKLWKKWHEIDLRDMVRRARNHPSVVMWSIGNETNEQNCPKLAKMLVSIVKSEDRTLPVTAGLNGAKPAIDSGLAKELDIMGINYWLWIYEYFEKKPGYEDKPYHASETACTISSRGEYFFPAKHGRDSRSNFQVSSYDLDEPGWGYLPDDQFRTLAKHPAALGEFVWSGWDYLGEPTPYNDDTTNLLNFRGDAAKRAELEKELNALGKITVPSRSTYFGIIDLAGFPKDRFYSYKSQWRPDVPTAHLLPHWNWSERAGEITPVHLYTSGDEAELFLNGQSLGKKKKGAEDYRLRWDDVKYAPGELRAEVFKNGKPWATDVVKTTGAAVKLTLEADRAVIKNDGRDLSFVTLRIVDKDGLTVPRTHNKIRFSIEGPGEIVATDNGDATSFESFQSPERKAFNGLALVIVKLKPGASGAVKVRAESDGLTPGETTISAK